MRHRLARLALSLYPLAHRRRYGAEMEALLDAGVVRLPTIIDLLRGALAAHLRAPGALEELVDPGARLRASASGVLASWVVFAAAGFGFYKTTEDEPFSAAGSAHPLLGAAHLAVQLLAVLASAAVIAGALPLIGRALGAARRERRLRALVILPPAAVVAFAVLTAVLAIAAGSTHPGPPTTIGGAAFIAWGVAGLLCAAVCVLAARAVLFALPLSPRLLLLALRFATVVSAGMAAIAVFAALYAITLAIDSPALSGMPNGPLALLSTGASLVVALAAMVASATIATRSVRRGWRAAPRLPTAGIC